MKQYFTKKWFLFLLFFLLSGINSIYATPGKTWQTAELIVSGNTNNASFTKETGDELWHKIEVAEDGEAVFTLNSETPLELHRIEFYTLKNNTELVKRDDKYFAKKVSNELFTISDLAKGTYYVKLSRWRNYGGYSIKYTFNKNNYTNDVEPNNTFNEANQIIKNGQTIQGHLGYQYLNDMDIDDWFKIEVAENGEAVFTLNSETPLELHWIELYTLKNNTELVKRDGKYFAKKVSNELLTISDLAKGTYYVKLSRWRNYGGYSIKYTFNKKNYTNDVEPNNTYKEANQIIKNGQTIQGHLGYHYLNDMDTEDWFKIEVAEDGEAVFTLNSETRLAFHWIELYTLKNNTELVKKADKYFAKSVSNELFTISNLAKGTYYLKLSRWNGYGGYSIYFGLLSPLAGSPIRCNVDGPKSVRKGVPTRYKAHFENISDKRTSSFMATLAFSSDINFIKAVIPTKNGNQVIEGAELINLNDSVQCFFVPYLNPYETYSFDVYVEGVSKEGGIVFPASKLDCGESDELQAVGTTLLFGAADAVGSDMIQDVVTDQIIKKVDLDAEEAQLYAKAMNLQVEQLNMKKEKDGIGVFTVKSLIKKTVEKASEINPVTKIAFKIGNAVEPVSSVSASLRRRFFYWAYKEIGLINPPKDIIVVDGKIAATRVVTSWDPNEKLGLVGYSDKNYIFNTQRLNYRINFENKKEATAPAYKIYVEDVLSNVFDLNTLRFEETSHQGAGYNWITNVENNKITWEIEGIELPPNATPPEGEGFVSFSIALKPEYQVSGTKIENKATIIFDKNAPIVTNTWVNILDMTEPTTLMQAANYIKNDDSVSISCNSKDNEQGSGVRYQLFYVSEDDGATYKMIGEGENKIKYPIDKNKNKNYRFYALAVDNVGNTEQKTPNYLVFNPLINGIETQLPSDKISVYPNPSKGIYFVDINDFDYDYYYISNLNGEILFTEILNNSVNDNDINNNKIKIDLSKHPVGTYILSFVTKDNRHIIKLIKE